MSEAAGSVLFGSFDAGLKERVVQDRSAFEQTFRVMLTQYKKEAREHNPLATMEDGLAAMLEGIDKPPVVQYTPQEQTVVDFFSSFRPFFTKFADHLKQPKTYEGAVEKSKFNQMLTGHVYDLVLKLQKNPNDYETKASVDTLEFLLDTARILRQTTLGSEMLQALNGARAQVGLMIFFEQQGYEVVLPRQGGREIEQWDTQGKADFAAINRQTGAILLIDAKGRAALSEKEQKMLWGTQDTSNEPLDKPIAYQIDALNPDYATIESTHWSIVRDLWQNWRSFGLTKQPIRNFKHWIILLPTARTKLSDPTGVIADNDQVLRPDLLKILQTQLVPPKIQWEPMRPKDQNRYDRNPYHRRKG